MSVSKLGCSLIATLLTFACASEPLRGASVRVGSSEGDGASTSDLASSTEESLVPTKVDAFRMHFARPFVGQDDDPNEFVLCPTGDDCFHSVTVYADGQIALDDHLGRTYAQLNTTERGQLEDLVFHDEALTAELAGGFGCPGIPSGYAVWIAATVRTADGTELLLSDVEGCIAGELTNQPEHRLTRLRNLLDDELRPRYADCEQDPQRPNCGAGMSSIVMW